MTTLYTPEQKLEMINVLFDGKMPEYVSYHTGKRPFSDIAAIKLQDRITALQIPTGASDDHFGEEVSMLGMEKIEGQPKRVMMASVLYTVSHPQLLPPHIGLGNIVADLYVAQSAVPREEAGVTRLYKVLVNFGPTPFAHAFPEQKAYVESQGMLYKPSFRMGGELIPFLRPNHDTE